jgi:hypothetical protein
MVRRFLCAIFSATLLVACNKKVPSQPQAEVTSTALSATATPEPIVNASMEDIDKKLQARQYEAAVGALVALNGMPKNDKQRAEFNQRLTSVNGALLQKAAQGDQQAAQSQMMLGRMLKGR